MSAFLHTTEVLCYRICQQIPSDLLKNLVRLVSAAVTNSGMLPLQVTRYQSSAASMSYSEYFSSSNREKGEANQMAEPGVAITALA